MRFFLITLGLAGFGSVASAASLLLDFQAPGHTTAPGYQAFEIANQANPATGNTTYAAFGGNVTVSVTTANLPDGNLDFRAVARNGAAGELVNDWIGVDTRNTGVDVTMTITLSGLPAGPYTWRSYHYDGGTGTTNGNLNGTNDYSIADANGLTTVPNGITIGQGNAAAPLAASILDFSFVSDGSDVVFSQIMDNGQGAPAVTPNALFAFTNGIEITQIPEPSSFLLGALGVLGLLRRRR